VFAAVMGRVAVVPVDHREAGAHQPGDREDGDAGPQRESGVGVTQVVEMAEAAPSDGAPAASGSAGLSTAWGDAPIDVKRLGRGSFRLP
jgi:hypothetical protein